MSTTSESPVHRVTVPLGNRSYWIHIEPGVLGQLGDLLAETVSGRHLIVVSDDQVADLYLATVADALQGQASRIDSLRVTPGERSKSVDVCNRLWQQLLDFSADRESIVVALGGGVVGDLAGFVAATFGRGIGLIQLPTSLLAQVDSSVGGKVGINLPQAKNMVGAFWQPQSVVIDPHVLSTLDHANYIAGMAEVVKYGVIMDLPLFESLEQSVPQILARDPSTLARMIARCCQCKSDVVQEDETERTGRRAILNYGHTYGHALETVYGYGQFLHGEAIAIGMTCAARLACQQGRVDQTFVDRQSDLLTQLGLPTRCPDDRHAELLSAMKRDKKVFRGQLKLILPTRFGHVELVDAPEDRWLLQSLCET